MESSADGGGLDWRMLSMTVKVVVVWGRCGEGVGGGGGGSTGGVGGRRALW